MEEGGGEYGRPRRGDPETISYLRGLPLDEVTAAKEARAYISAHRSEDGSAAEENEPAEFPESLSATHAALSSIYHEIASLACEEDSCQQIETLIRISCRFSMAAKRIVLSSLSGYWVFLSTHRFGSHVAQTALRCAVAECEENLDAFGGGKSEGGEVVEDSYGSLLQNEDGSGGSVPHSLSQILLDAIEELKQYASDLSVHVCGTHVLRSSVCILSGVEFVEAFPKPGGNNQGDGQWDSGVLAATRRGKQKDKKKKKKKGRPQSEEESGAKSPQEVTVMRNMKVVSDLKSEDFREKSDAMLEELVNIITLSSNNNHGEVQPPGEVQQHTCHASANPLLVQLVRILSYLDFHSKPAQKKSGAKKIVPDRRLGIHEEEPRYSAGSQAETLVNRLLCWDPNVCGDGNGDNSEDERAKQPYASDIIYGLSGEPRGSILLEAILRCSPDSFHDELCQVGAFYDDTTLREYIQHGVSNFVVQVLFATSRSREQTAKLVKPLVGIVEDGSILKPNSRGADEGATEESGAKNSRRMGVIWRASEMCANVGSAQDQEQLLHSIMRGFSAATGRSEEGDTELSDGKKKRKRSKAKGLPAYECIPLLLGLKPGRYDESCRLTLDAAGARVLHHIFQFKERLRAEWVESFFDIYTCEDLVGIANDGLGSRW